MKKLFALTACAALLAAARLYGAIPEDRLVFDSMPSARFEFRGPVGDRVRANVDNWLLRAPQANPGMLEMFRVRDRKPTPQLVPWAGEFVGKYIISTVQALRMSDDARLREQVSRTVSELLSTQAEDGYLGPFPKDVRLLKHWDLWGHYHAIYALLLWHEYSGDAASLAGARRAADLVCATYLDTDRRVYNAGDHEMNMAILTAMTMLHRVTAEPRYLRMAREVEKDWERAGDYLRAGLDGREFFQSPRPRWESLHDLQGLVELWRITGEAKYREAFVHHWRSIRRWDRRNTGGFSSGEQATGNPFAPTAIETCCTVAWAALTIDYLRLTGDARAVDELELSTLNGGLGAQHPSGRWWTYNTPMEGAREASAHSIVFQARAGTPELNCCSVNGPRLLGMLSEWSVMRASDGLVLNWFGPVTASMTLNDGTEVKLRCESNYPREGTARWTVELPKSPLEFALHVRLPGWSATTVMKINGMATTLREPGRFHRIHRRWQNGDTVELSLDLSIRAVTGANEAGGKVSLYRGPLLLAYDQRFNDFDEDAIPAVDVRHLERVRLASISRTTNQSSVLFDPWLLIELPADGGRTLRLVDFASAGSSGTRYRTWLPANLGLPAPALSQFPRDGARVPLGEVPFQWRGPKNARDVSYRVEYSADEMFGKIDFATNAKILRLTLNTHGLMPNEKSAPLRLWWRVVTRNQNGETIADVPPALLILDRDAPAPVLPAVLKTGPNAELIVHSLRGEARPLFGELKSARFVSRDAQGTELNGRNQMMVYAVPVWPEEDFTVAVRVRVNEIPRGRLGQIFSAWAAGSDDPLRLVLDGGKLFARIEAGAGVSTPGTQFQTNQWHAIAAVKQDAMLRLYVDGALVGTCSAPDLTSTRANAFALGGNPHFSGNEFLAAKFADFQFDARGWTADEIQRWTNQE